MQPSTTEASGTCTSSPGRCGAVVGDSDLKLVVVVSQSQSDIPGAVDDRVGHQLRDDESGVLCRRVRQRPLLQHGGRGSSCLSYVHIHRLHGHLEDVRGQRTPSGRGADDVGATVIAPRSGWRCCPVRGHAHIAPWLRDPEQGKLEGEIFVKGGKQGGVEGSIGFLSRIGVRLMQWIHLPSCSVTCGVTRIGRRTSRPVRSTPLPAGQR